MSLRTYAKAEAIPGELRLARHHVDGVRDSRRHRDADEQCVSDHERADGPDLQPGVLGVHDCHLHQRRTGGRASACALCTFVSALGYIVGVGLILLAPLPSAPVASIFGETGTLMLYLGFLIMGLSQGLVEGVINPLVATIYADEKTRKLNMLHAWWPGGLVIGGLLAVALTTTVQRHVAGEARLHRRAGGRSIWSWR